MAAKSAFFLVLISCLAARACARHGVDHGNLPHVDTCRTCMVCHLDGTASDTEVSELDIIDENFQPQNEHQKQTMPDCPECWGCTTNLTTLVKSGSKRMFGRDFVNEGGASPSWLFVAPTDKTESGEAIVKVSCIPVAKLHDKAHGGVPAAKPTCHAGNFVHFTQLYLAMEMLAEDCGLTDIIPKVWVEKVNGVIPGLGYHVRWHALYMEKAPGISLENLVRLGNPMMHPDEFLEIMHSLNHTQIVRAAIWDLLTSQCDRHAQNLFIAEDKTIKLIDNERAFFDGKHCGVDSIFLPTTKKFTINVMENAWVHKFKNWGDKEPKCWANVPLLLDYRCYVEGGKIGLNLPPTVQRCLRKIKSLSLDDLQLEYGFPDRLTTQALRNRSLAMLTMGFEDALTRGYPQNPEAWRYRFAEPCCKIKHTDMYRCAHDWNPDTAIPFGDPVSGSGEWKRDWPDHGSYKGGSSFEETPLAERKPWAGAAAIAEAAAAEKAGTAEA